LAPTQEEQFRKQLALEAKKVEVLLNLFDCPLEELEQKIIELEDG
jgi:hypothetical protein